MTNLKEKIDMKNKKKKTGIKMKVSVPRCLRCRERAYSGDMPIVMDILTNIVNGKSGIKYPITITFTKK